MIDKVILGKLVRKYRHIDGITRKELAARTGVNESSLSRIERGLLRPSLDNLDNLAIYFAWSLSLIFDKCRVK